MPEYVFKGKVELSGATFFVTAKDENEAKLKALSGEWDDYDTATAETVNTEIDPTTIDLNE